MPTSDSADAAQNHDPWNKGRLLGQKRPLRPKDVWTIRVRLQLEGRKRDLAMFNLAIDKKTSNLPAVQLLLGHTRLESTMRYLGIEVADALRQGRQITASVERSRRGAWRLA